MLIILSLLSRCQESLSIFQAYISMDVWIELRSRNMAVNYRIPRMQNHRISACAARSHFAAIHEASEVCQVLFNPPIQNHGVLLNLINETTQVV